MQQVINQSAQMDNLHHQKSRLDSVLPQNQELINNLNRKIDRRLNNGYYFQVAAQRKPFLPTSTYKKRPINNKPKKPHPIIKKVVKQNEQKPLLVEQQQNTDEAEFSQKWQNTSGEYVLKEPDPILQDEQMQWSCQPTQIQKKNHSMQWSIEPIQQFNEEVQYTLQSELIIIQCRDASIQVDPQPLPQPQLLPQPVKPILEDISMQCQKVKIENQEVQCEKVQNQHQQIQCQKIKNQQVQIQYNEPLPEKKQINLQIDLPDLQQLSKISSMENRLKYLKLQQRKMQKLQKNKEKQVQILKLKQVMEKLEGKIQLAQEKQLNLKKRMENQMMMKQLQTKFGKEKQQIKQQAQKQYNKKLESLISKIKQGPPTTTRQINNSYKQEEQRRKEELKREQQQSKEELVNYKKQVQDLKKQLKGQMFKRLRYQNDSDQDTATEQNYLSNSRNKLSFSAKKQHDISMDSLFPNLKNRNAGAIIKNIPSDMNKTSQKKLNQYQEMARSSRAYWKSKSPFNYQYQQTKRTRIDRKYSYLQKVSQKNINNIASNPQQNLQNYSPMKPKTKFDFKNKGITLKYDFKKISYSWEQIKLIKKDIDDFYGNQQLFRYLYSQQDKIKLGLQLFAILKIKIDRMIPKPIQIYKYQNYIVFQYRVQTGIHFIMFYHHTKSIIAGILPKQNTNYQFYQSSQTFKNGEIFQYLSQNQLFNGYYANGQKEGFGILSNQLFYYQGHFRGGKKEGSGKLILENGDTYQGQFKNNHLDGEGTYTWVNGQSYDGFFSKGLKHGFGRQYFKNGDVYQGEYKYSKRDGSGIYKWKDGSIYQGQFRNDQKCGEGKLTAPNGSVLVGEWKGDQIFELISKQNYKGRSREELPLAKKLKNEIQV